MNDMMKVKSSLKLLELFFYVVLNKDICDAEFCSQSI